MQWRFSLPALLYAWLCGLWWVGATAEASWSGIVVFAGLYGLLVVFAHGLVEAAARVNHLAAWLGSVPVGFLVVAQLEEQLLIPKSLRTAAWVGLVVAWVYGELVWRLGGSREMLSKSSLRPLLTSLAAGLVLVACCGLVLKSELLRWALLRHHPVLGTPSFYLYEEPVSDVWGNLFERHGAQPVPETRGVAVAGAVAADPLAPSEAPVPFGTRERPNVVFLLLDTLRADGLAAWGASPQAMPRLDRFLDEGYRFTDVWANSSWTRSSMVSYFTGLLPEEHGVRTLDHRIPEALTMLPEIFQASGYTTVAFMTNVGALGRSTGFDQGFDLFRQMGVYPYARAGKLRRTVERWLDTPEAPDRGLFLYVHFMDPHDPYLTGEPPAMKAARLWREAYRRELSYLDREVEGLLHSLDRHLTGPTVYVVASDHGEEFREHGLMGHAQSVYEEVIHVPVGMVFSPGDGKGQAGDLTNPLEGRDFFDLLARIARGEEVSIPLWAQSRERQRRYSSIYFIHYALVFLRPYRHWIAMRSLQEGHHKLVWSAYGETLELYDLQADPGETRNLVAERPEVVRRLFATLDEPIHRWRLPQSYAVTEASRQQLRALGYLD